MSANTRDFQTRFGLVVGNNYSFYVNTSTGFVGIGTPTPNVSLQVNSTGAIGIPVGNTAQRPTGNSGFFRYNTDSKSFEGYANGSWGNVGGSSVAGVNGSIQYDNSGALAGSANLVFDGVSTLSVPVNIVPSQGSINLNGNSSFRVAAFDPSGFFVIKQRVQSIGSITGAFNWDCSNGNITSLTLTGATTITPINASPGFYTVIINNPQNAITWGGGNFMFPGGVHPPGSGSGLVDVYSFVYDGIHFLGTQIPSLASAS